MATEKTAMTEEMISDRVQKLREEIESLGRWGIVDWCNGDIAHALEDQEIDPTPEHIQKVWEHPFVGQIDDRMTETGWEVIHEAIYDLGLPVSQTLVRKFDEQIRKIKQRMEEEETEAVKFTRISGPQY